MVVNRNGYPTQTPEDALAVRRPTWLYAAPWCRKSHSLRDDDLRARMKLGRFEEPSLRDVYSRSLKLLGKEKKTISANNYACLLRLGRKARSLLLEAMPVSRHVLGENDEPHSDEVLRGLETPAPRSTISAGRDAFEDSGRPRGGVERRASAASWRWKAPCGGHERGRPKAYRGSVKTRADRRRRHRPPPLPPPRARLRVRVQNILLAVRDAHRRARGVTLEAVPLLIRRPLLTAAARRRSARGVKHNQHRPSGRPALVTVRPPPPARPGRSAPIRARTRTRRGPRRARRGTQPIDGSIANGLESGEANWTTRGGGIVSNPATARCKVWRAPVSIAVSLRSHVGSDTYSRPRKITTSTPQGSRPCKRWRNADDAARDPLILVGKYEVCSLINEAPSKTGPPLRNAKKSGTRALAGSTTVALGALSDGNARRAHRAPDSPSARLQAPRTPAAEDSPAARGRARGPVQHAVFCSSVRQTPAQPSRRRPGSSILNPSARTCRPSQAPKVDSSRA